MGRFGGVFGHGSTQHAYMCLSRELTAYLQELPVAVFMLMLALALESGYLSLHADDRVKILSGEEPGHLPQLCLC